VIGRQPVVHPRTKSWVVVGLLLLAASVASPPWHETFLRGVSTAERLSSNVALPLSSSEVPAGFLVQSWMPVPRTSLAGSVEGYATTLLGPGAGNQITFLRFGTADEAAAYVAEVRGKPVGDELGGGPVCIQGRGKCLAAFGPVVVTGSSHSQCYGIVDDAALARARELLRAGATHLRHSA